MHSPPRSERAASADSTDAGTTRDALVTDHLHVVQRIVNELAARLPRHVDRDELWNAGALGLVEAASRYDPQTGVPFAGFAALRVRGAILDATRVGDGASRGTRRAARTLEQAREALQQRTGRAPSDTELAVELDLDPAQVRAQRAAVDAAEVVWLDEPMGGSEDGETWTRTELLEELGVERLPEDALLQRELIGTLRTAVAHLPERLRHLIEGYYLRGEFLHDLAEELGVTEARASQLRTEAVASLQAYFAAHFDAPELAPDAGAAGARQRGHYVTELAGTSWRTRVEAAGVGAGVGAGVSG